MVLCLCVSLVVACNPAPEEGTPNTPNTPEQPTEPEQPTQPEQDSRNELVAQKGYPSGVEVYYFKNYYEDYTFNLVRDGQTIVTFAKGETKAAFIDGYKVSIEGSVKSATNTKTFSKEYSNLNEATAYTVVFDVKNVGGASITVSFNNEVVEVPLGDIELND